MTCFSPHMCLEVKVEASERGWPCRGLQWQLSGIESTSHHVACDLFLEVYGPSRFTNQGSAVVIRRTSVQPEPHTLFTVQYALAVYVYVSYQHIGYCGTPVWCVPAEGWVWNLCTVHQAAAPPPWCSSQLPHDAIGHHLKVELSGHWATIAHCPHQKRRESQSFLGAQRWKSKFSTMLMLTEDTTWLLSISKSYLFGIPGAKMCYIKLEVFYSYSYS